MSVLLDALKKAAAEKKALEQQNLASALRPVLSTQQAQLNKKSSPSPSKTDTDKTSSAEDIQPIKLDFNFDIEEESPPPSKKVEPKPDTTPKKPSSAAALNLRLDDSSEPVSPPAEQLAPRKKNTPAEASLSAFKMADVEEVAPIISSSVDLDALDDELDALTQSLSDMSSSVTKSEQPKQPTQSKTDIPANNASLSMKTKRPQTAEEVGASVSTSDVTDDLSMPSLSPVMPQSESLPSQTTQQVTQDIQQLQQILTKATQTQKASPAKRKSRMGLWLVLTLLLVSLGSAYFLLKNRTLWQSYMPATPPLVETEIDLVDEQTIAPLLPDEIELNPEQTQPHEAVVSEPTGLIDTQIHTQPEQGEKQICDLPLETKLPLSRPPSSASLTPVAPKKEPIPKLEAKVETKVETKTVKVQPIVQPAFNELAYEAYQQGDFELAEERYKQALTHTPNNKTSLLGLAAIAAQYSDWTKAMRFYREVLEQFPRDSDALQGIASIASALESTTELKRDLMDLNRRFPESAVLQFALGNVYAQENDWFKAQQAYFESVRLDMTNPDYRLNLAVSFDRLGQYALALEHYKMALTLNTDSRTRFDAETVTYRIGVLERFLERRN